MMAFTPACSLYNKKTHMTQETVLFISWIEKPTVSVYKMTNVFGVHHGANGE